jgi:hypothetical protein
MQIGILRDRQVWCSSRGRLAPRSSVLVEVLHQRRSYYGYWMIGEHSIDGAPDTLCRNHSRHSAPQYRMLVSNRQNCYPNTILPTREGLVWQICRSNSSLILDA